MPVQIYLGADHAGFEMKEAIREFLLAKQYQVEDLGTHSSDSVDYPDFAHPVAEAVEKKERYATPEEYKANLVKFIKETKALKAYPILLTPVTRRKFDKEGRIMETHEAYSKLVREVAAGEQVPLIDLDTKSRDLLQEFGEQNSKLLFLQLKPGEHPNYPEGKSDNTHFNELGARLIAQIVLKEIRQQVPELAKHIRQP